jgi:nucleotide-binding universal stress UspA family protein
VKPIRRILVATDFSEHSARALGAAVDLAVRFGAEIDVVHAFDLPIPLLTPYEVAVPDSYLDQTRNAAAQKLAAAAEEVSARGVEVKTHLREVPAAPAIAQAAEDLGADLIVMGTRGNTGLKHVLLGSVAERTLRLAPCSVLAVKGDGG